MANTLDQLSFNPIDEKILIPCLKCDEYVEVQDIHKHREMHRALKIFRSSTIETMPKTMKQLLKRRRQIINEALAKLDEGSQLPAKVLQKIDWAFEILRKNITSKDFTESSPAVDENNLKKEQEVTGIAEKLEKCGQAIGICHVANDTYRTTDEDRYIFKEDISSKDGHCFFGLFDGYNGVTAAEKCSKHFYAFLVEELCAENNQIEPNFDEMSEEELTERESFVKECMKAAFYKMDSFLLIGESESSKVRWSGTSATICYIENDTLYVANSGNVRALFVREDGSAESLIGKHTPQNKEERERIKKANGDVSFSQKLPMVNGLVSSTRGLGNHGDPNLKRSVILEPHISVARINHKDQFIILYTAGIWEVFSDDDVMFLLEDITQRSEIDSLRQHFTLSAESGSRNEIDNEISDEKYIPNKESEVHKAEPGAGSLLTVTPSTAFDATHEISPRSKDSVSQNNEENKNDWPTDLHLEERFVSQDSLINAHPRDSVEQKLEKLSAGEMREGEMYREIKTCNALAKELVERLAYSALLADSRENITALVVLLQGCPINLYLLTDAKRDSTDE
eukprot:Seg1348.9 transcript_id=Seg1348.9/GoldUCD/mRNA.D3Y31 product="Protein phosphatase 2C-like domain-containing protein 1" protein_id=Seg1348.9/GoldUCD/D3Y31